jgi:hypothetical protein
VTRLTRVNAEQQGEVAPGEAAGADLAGLDIAALAFEHMFADRLEGRECRRATCTLATGGENVVRVCAVDVEGDLRELATRPGRCAARSLQCVHVEVLAELLRRGLRARRQVLVWADGCPRLVSRVRAAFGSQNVVLVPER